ncbi:MAG: hypothetical protein IKV21_05780, partial [Clostridia bacterium]|nr:hypothetical protein [Clostridia bacterium]
MEKIKLWCGMLSCISVLFAVIELIVSDDKNKKGLHVLLSVILLFAFIYPVKADNDTLASFLDEFDYSRFEENEAGISEYQNYAGVLAVQSEAEKYLEEKLSEERIDATVDVECSIEEGVIKISTVNISGDINSQVKEYIISLVEEAFG